MRRCTSNTSTMISLLPLYLLSCGRAGVVAQKKSGDFEILQGAKKHSLNWWWISPLESICLSCRLHPSYEFPIFSEKMEELALQAWERSGSRSLIGQVDYQQVMKHFHIWQGKAEELGLNYTSWPELTNSPVMQRFKSRVKFLSATFLRRLGIFRERSVEEAASQMRVSVTAEVYEGRGAALPPRHHMNEGAVLTGLYWAHVEEESNEDNPMHFLDFEDPRGINHPYGREKREFIEEGKLIFFPPWMSYYSAPLPGGRRVDWVVHIHRLDDNGNVVIEDSAKDKASALDYRIPIKHNTDPFGGPLNISGEGQCTSST